MTAIEEMAGMDVLCSDKTGTLTLNKLTVDKNLVEVQNFALSRQLLSLFWWENCFLEHVGELVESLFLIELHFCAVFHKRC